MQSTLGFRIDSPYPRKHFGRAFFGNTLAGNDLKAARRTGSPLSTTNITAVQADRDGRPGFGRRLDLELASGIVGELFRAEFRFESLSGREHVSSYRLDLKAPIDRENIVQQINYCSKR